MHLRQREATALHISGLATKQAMVLAVGADLIFFRDRSRQALVATRELRRQEIRAADASRAERIERMLRVRELILDVLREHGGGALPLRPGFELRRRYPRRPCDGIAHKQLRDRAIPRQVVHAGELEAPVRYGRSRVSRSHDGRVDELSAPRGLGTQRKRREERVAPWAAQRHVGRRVELEARARGNSDRERAAAWKGDVGDVALLERLDSGSTGERNEEPVPDGATPRVLGADGAGDDQPLATSTRAIDRLARRDAEAMRR